MAINKHVLCAGDIGFAGEAADAERDLSMVHEHVRFLSQEPRYLEGKRIGWRISREWIKYWKQAWLTAIHLERVRGTCPLIHPHPN